MAFVLIRLVVGSIFQKVNEKVWFFELFSVGAMDFDGVRQTLSGRDT